MLILSRKKNERIVINDDITIVLVEIRGDKVRLGIDAPKNTTVHREEVYNAIKAQAAAEAARPLAEECVGKGRGGMGRCCARAGEYNGFGSDGPTAFTCPAGCSCHD